MMFADFSWRLIMFPIGITAGLLYLKKAIKSVWAPQKERGCATRKSVATWEIAVLSPQTSATNPDKHTIRAETLRLEFKQRPQGRIRTKIITAYGH